jgi:hypothetical protein
MTALGWWASHVQKEMISLGVGTLLDPLQASGYRAAGPATATGEASFGPAQFLAPEC